MRATFAEQRKMLPRWRRFQDPANLEELNSIKKKPLTKSESGEHSVAIECWKEDHNLENAIELCSSAIVHCRFEDAGTAASYIIENKPRSPSVVLLAQKVLHPDRKVEAAQVDNRRVEIAILKKRSHNSPHNAAVWVDLALAYAALGQNDKAKRSIEVALAIAPHNRFVVRCAARFFVHIRNDSRARRIVKDYRFLRNDPWVLAVDLSLSSAEIISSRHVKLAKTMVDRNAVPPFHASELAVTLSEIEGKNSAYRSARKLLESALVDPTENSIAHAQWVKNRHELDIPLNDNVINRDSVREAQVYKHLDDGDWHQCMSKAKRWSEREPYSTRPFEIMTYVSCVCQDNHNDCVNYSKHGLKLGMNNFSLLNNLTIGYALSGDIENANATFGLIKASSLNEDDRPVYIATKGMLAFKRKNIDEGTDLYDTAIAKIGYTDKRAKSIARLFLAREKILANTPDARTFFEDLKTKLDGDVGRDVVALKMHIEKLVV